MANRRCAKGILLFLLCSHQIKQTMKQIEQYIVRWIDGLNRRRIDGKKAVAINGADIDCDDCGGHQEANTLQPKSSQQGLC